MDMLYSHKIRLQLCLLLPLHFSSLLLSSADNTFPVKYLINCGGNSNVTFNNGVFVADTNSPSFSTGESEQVNNFSTSIPPLYQTARLYRMPSSYGFEIDRERGVYTLYASISLLSCHVLIYMMFNVSASGFSLLTNFSIGNGTSSPVIKEFLLTIPQGEFRIHFIPSQQSSLAFINAIEVFLANENRITDDVLHVTYAGDNGFYSGFLSQALHTIGRITFGGSPIEYDELWRSWVNDDSYLILNRDYAMNCTIYQSINREWVSKYTAPDRIYQSCKQLKPDSDGNSKALKFNLVFSRE